MVSCDHKTIESSGMRKLVVNCKRCEREHSISDCLPGLLLSLEDKYDIDSIIVSDFMEKQYIGPGVDILSQMRDMAGAIESLSSRRQNRDECMSCELRPAQLYPNLKRKFIEDPGSIYSELRSIAEKTDHKQGCPGCKKSLMEEIEILGKKAISLKSDILAEGFDIVG